MNRGALHVWPDRQLTTPLPNSPPITNAAFFIPGITAIHSAAFHVSSGMPLSGIARSSRTTDAPSSSRLACEDEISALAIDALSKTPIDNATVVFILYLQSRDEVQKSRRVRFRHAWALKHRTGILNLFMWWALKDSNLRPRACETARGLD